MNVSQSVKQSFSRSVVAIKNKRGLMHIVIILMALVAFEAFNFSTTDFALSDLLGDLRFGGFRWATLLAVAFCGIDYAGIARLFAPAGSKEESRSVWFMFGAWILAATMNAILTWWGVVMAMQTHPVISTGLVGSSFVSKFVPIFIAILVWIIRILLIGALTKKGEELAQAENDSSGVESISRRQLRQAQSRAAHAPDHVARSVPAGFSQTQVRKPERHPASFRPEPTYAPLDEEVAYRSFKAQNRTKNLRS